MPDTKFCRYSCRNAGYECCWLCHRHPDNIKDKDKPCKFACTLKCLSLIKHESKTLPVVNKPVKAARPCRLCRIRYAAFNNKKPVISNGVEPKYRDLDGKAICMAKGPGPRNVLIETKEGLVVVPFGNVRWLD